MKHMVKQPFQDRRAWKKEYVHKTMEHYKVERKREKLIEEIQANWKKTLEEVKEAWTTILTRAGVALENAAKMINNAIKNVSNYYMNHGMVGEMPPNVQEAIKNIEAHEENKKYFETGGIK